MTNEASEQNGETAPGKDEGCAMLVTCGALESATRLVACMDDLRRATRTYSKLSEDCLKRLKVFQKSQR